jgi:ABC-type branched-subunit amino acid transport system substrate-binding protein
MREARRGAIRTSIAAAAFVSLGVLAACGSSAQPNGGSGGTGSGGGASAGKVLKVAMFVDASGALGPGFSPAVGGMEAAAAAFNDGGGANGVKVSVKLYDTASTASGGVSAARAAIADGSFAVVPVSQLIDGALPLLASAKMPVTGYGVSPNWYSGTCATCYSWSGNIVSINTTSWVDMMVRKGHKRLALFSDVNDPGGLSGGKLWKRMIPAAGGTVALYREGVDASNSAAISALARQIVGSGAQGVLTSGATGGPQIQSALNALGSKIPVLQPVVYGAAAAKQYGNAINGMIFANVTATPDYTNDPGIETYLATMKKYNKDPAGFALQGYISMKFLLDTIKSLPGTPTQQKLLRALSILKGYDSDGLICPVDFPAFQQQAGSPCLSASQFVGGRWTQYSDGGKTFWVGKAFR